MLAAFVLVAVFDVIFAIDSIPAIFAITRDVFVVFAANAFSLLGLAALYFLLAGAIARFRYLNVGLAAVLIFVGFKMISEEFLHISSLVALAVIIVTLGIAIGVSWFTSDEPVGEEAMPPSPHAPGPDDPGEVALAGREDSRGD
jgi:tellurite resistance protein TerC